MSQVLLDTIDYLIANLNVTAWRDQGSRFLAGIALLDKHRLWTPRTQAARKASAALVTAMARTMYDLFGSSLATDKMFRRSEKQCGAECVRFVEAFGLQKHRYVKDYWKNRRA